jgi:hypothetical protein
MKRTGRRRVRDEPLPPMHAFNHAPAALRIFRFAADTAPRVLELAHVSAFLRECAVKFGSADATLPGALSCEYAAKRYFELRAVVERKAARCPWLAAKLLACRSGAPIPAAALAPDVTRHDVNWGAEGARRHDVLQLTHDGHGLTCGVSEGSNRWAQGPIGVSSGKHYFQVCVSNPAADGNVNVGWVDDKFSLGRNGSGASYLLRGSIWCINFGTAPMRVATLLVSLSVAAPRNIRSCVVGCLLDMAATPARMTVFVDGEPLAVQCPYDFPKDGRAWFPSVSLCQDGTALHSCAM